MTDQIKYRKDIDGLRAIAVLAVVFYHAKWPVFSGGFVGVDVFFVISGFLIANILKRESENSEPYIKLISADKLLCPDEGKCKMFSGKKSLYYDTNHLSLDGAKIIEDLIRPIFQRLQNDQH